MCLSHETKRRPGQCCNTSGPQADGAQEAPSTMISLQQVAPVVEVMPWEVAETTVPLFECMTPHELGFADAADGELCVPEMYFVRRTQMVEYAEGFEAYAGPTLLSRQIMRPYGEVAA